MKESSSGRSRTRRLYSQSAAVFRWLHIYVSMLGFASLMFFALTGLTLNHPTWFGAGEQLVKDATGNLSHVLGNGTQGADEQTVEQEVNQLEVAEWLRATHRLRGRVTDFSTDEWEIMVVFKGPGYSADVFIDRNSGNYTLTESVSGVMAVMNDLHKGRNSGTQWSWVIDVSAVGTMVLSLSGFGLLFYVRRRRRSGLITAFVGTLALIVVWGIWVP